MQELIKILQNRVLPFLRKHPGKILVPGQAPFLEPAPDTQTHFIEAYHPQHHPFFETTWLLRGTAHLKVEGRIYEFATGDLCFLPPFITHADVYGRRTPEYESLWFSHAPGWFHISYFHYQPFGQCTSRTIGAMPAGPETLAMFLALQNEGARRDDYSSDAMHGLLQQFAVLLLRNARSQPEGEPAPIPGELSQRVRRYLEENYASPIRLEKVADQLGLSANYVATVYKHESGQTILQALTAIRMGHAVRLLLTEGLPVKSVARAVGYTSAEHFSRTFRRHKGVAPNRYGRREGSVRNVMKPEDSS